MNGDFENVVDFPTDWNPEGIAETVTDPPLYLNSRVAQLIEGGRISQVVNGIIGDCPYQLSVAVRTPSIEKPLTMVFSFRDQDSFAISPFPIQNTLVTSDATGYTTYIFRFNAPSGTASALIGFQDNNPGIDSVINLDNVIFSRG